MKRISLLISIFILSALLLFPDNGSAFWGFGNHVTPSTQSMANLSTIAKRIISNTQYRPTPGDTYQLIIRMETTQVYSLVLQQNYELDVPFIGTINVKGMTFKALRAYVHKKIKSSIPTDYVSFILQSPAQFDIFVYGGIATPGIITVNPLARVWDAILLAKGFKPGGSFRRVYLFRKGEERVLDLAQFTLKADLSQNPTLEPGDKIYIPQAQVVVSISGKVPYPGKYELLPGETLKDLLGFAGGLSPDAIPDKIEITRLKSDGSVEVSYAKAMEAEKYVLLNGDKVNVPSKFENKEMIMVEGALYGRPLQSEKAVKIPVKPIVVNIPYYQGVTLLDILKQLGGPTPYAEAERSYVVRAKSGKKIPVDVKKLWSDESSPLNIPIEPGDYILIPMKKLQVFVSGQVANPGAVPFSSGYTVADYILASGGIDTETGDPNGIYFVDEKGNRRKASLTDEVSPGNVIFVEKNAWTKTQKMFDNIVVVTGFITSVITFTNLILDFINSRIVK